MKYRQLKIKTVRMNETNVQVVPQENQLTELAGEIAVLREMLTLLKENLASLNEAVNQTRNPVISRQIKTIHLKRASPVIAAEQASLKVSEDTNLEQPDVNLSPDNRENQEGETTVATSEPAPPKKRCQKNKKTSRVPRQNLYLLFHKKQKKLAKFSE